MAEGNKAVFVAESDEDSINTDSTVESEQDSEREYGVEEILAEHADDEGKMHYLLKWEGYPLYRCTWEMADNISSEELLDEWEAVKRLVKEGKKTKFDVEAFNEAFERHYGEKEDRRRRRIAKRRKRGEIVGSPANESSASDDEDDLERPEPRKRRKVKASPPLRKGVAQPATKRPSKARPVEDDDDVVMIDSDDYSPFEESSSIVLSPKKRKFSTGTVNSRKATPRSAAASMSTAGKKEAITKVARPAPTSTSTVGKKDGIDRPNATPAAKIALQSIPARKSAPSTASKPVPLKRLSTSNVFGEDWAGEKKRRQRQRVSGETPKDSADPKFHNLSTQNRYRKYSRNEPVPDPDALVFLDPKSGAIQPPTATPAATGPTEINSAYGRRTPPPVSRVRTPSPSSPPPVKQEPIYPATNPGAAVSAQQPEISSVPARTYDARKEITCRDWQSGSCQYTAEGCSYTHGYGNSNYNTKKNTTCFYWAQGGKCKYSADDCAFAHWDTGVYAGPPGSYFLSQRAINDADASLMRENERLPLPLPPPPPPPAEENFIPPNEPPPLQQGPQLKTGLPNASPAPIKLSPPSLVTSPTEVPGPEPADRADSAVITTPLSPSAKVKDPRLATRAEAAAVALPTANVADPRLNGRRPSMPKVYTPPLDQSHWPDPAANMAEMTWKSPSSDGSRQLARGSIEADLEMARRALPKLDISKLLKGKDGEIEHVMIHMPNEHAGEAHLLYKHFRDLNCKPFTSHKNQWDHVRNMFGSWKSCLLLLHPSELYLGTIPDLHRFVLTAGSKLQVFSIGVLHQQGMKEGREPKYGFQRLFPHGGITFISDDVFVYYPEKATEIIQQFLDGTASKPQGAELSKIGARPGVKYWMVRLAREKFEEQGGEGKCTDLRWIKCYEALCILCPPKDEDLNFPDQQVPSETSHLWSIPEDSLPSFKGRWESGDEAGATEYMVNHFAGEACNVTWKYKRFVFVYQRPETEGKPDPKGWMKKYCHIGVVTPEQVLKSKTKGTLHDRPNGVPTAH